MTLAETIVRLGAGIESLGDAEMARKPALLPDEDEDEEFTSELQVTFGRNVRAARLKAGLTQADAAARSGLRQDDISRIEAGQVNVTIRTMGRLAKAFDGDVWAMLLAVKEASS